MAHRRRNLQNLGESNENCTEWIFHLMDGVTFSDGEKFNADAVVDNYNRYTDGTEGLDMSNYYPGLEKVEKVDDKTVKMTFAEPIPRKYLYRLQIITVLF